MTVPFSAQQKQRPHREYAKAEGSKLDNAQKYSATQKLVYVKPWKIFNSHARKSISAEHRAEAPF